jgi:hypothetical protein
LLPGCLRWPAGIGRTTPAKNGTCPEAAR